MSDIKWIKLSINVFDDEKFDAIKTLPDSNDIQLAWIKLLCLAGKCNESGFLMLTREIPYTDEMLASRFGMDIGIVQRALAIFQKLEMVDVIDNVYMVSNWLKYQSGDELEKVKQQNRERQQRHREKQKELLLEQKNDSNVTDNVTDNVKNNGKCSISISDSLSNNSDIDTIKNIVNYLNTTCNTNYRYSSDATKKKIRARLNEGFTEDDFYAVIDVKHGEWGNDPSMSKYLRPETLFGTKFEGYLNQCPRKEIQVDNSTGSDGDIQWQ